MKKIFKKKSGYSRAFALSVFIFVTVLCVYGIYKNSNVKPANIDEYIKGTEVKNKGKEAGRMDSIIEYGDRITMAVHYPVFENPMVDMIIHDDIRQLIGEFKIELAKDSSTKGFLHCDYSAYLVDDTHVSATLLMEKSFSSYAHPDMIVRNYVFDTEANKRMVMADIIDPQKMSDFTNLVMNKITNLEGYTSVENINIVISEYFKSNPYSFYLSGDGVVIKFEKYSILPGYFGSPEILIPYSEAGNFFKSDFKFGNVISQAEAQQQENQLKNQQPPEEVPVKRVVDESKPMVALTFDDGPHPQNTRIILKALSQYKGAATFYMLGNRADSYGDVIEEIVAHGSEVENHSWSHTNYTKRTAGEIKSDKDKSQNAIKKYSGHTPITMRVPYGAINDTVKSSVGMPIVLWSVDTNDWKDKDSKTIIEWVTTNIKDGDIILMHDIWPETANSVLEIAKKLTDNGFQLVTVSEMAKARKIELKSGNKYFSFNKK